MLPLICRPKVPVILIALPMLCFLAPGTRAQTATPPPPPRSTPLLHRSLTTMHDSLHAVHAAGSDRWVQGHVQAMLQVAGDCIMKSGGIRSAFHVWGTRLTSSGNGRMVPERYDRRFIFIWSSAQSAQVWERNALTDRRWRKNNSNNDALIVFSLCPATTQFGQSFQGTPALKNVGAVTIGNSTTWHLRAQKAQTRGKESTRYQLDVYIDQGTQYLVKVRSDTERTGKTATRYTWTRRFSRFNVPVSIQAPT